MERVIDITRTNGQVSFAAVEVGIGESVFWRNNDKDAPHWPTILDKEIPAFKGVPHPPTSNQVPATIATSAYGCQIAGHEHESGAITIYPALAITTATAITIPVNTPYSLTLAATGGKSADTQGNSLYVWTILGSDLPPGLTLSNGIISGTPTTTGATNFTLQVTDGLGNDKIAGVTITVQ